LNVEKIDEVGMDSRNNSRKRSKVDKGLAMFNVEMTICTLCFNKYLEEEMAKANSALNYDRGKEDGKGVQNSHQEIYKNMRFSGTW
jgi:hypothetical protein